MRAMIVALACLVALSAVQADVARGKVVPFDHWAYDLVQEIVEITGLCPPPRPGVNPWHDDAPWTRGDLADTVLWCSQHIPELHRTDLSGPDATRVLVDLDRLFEEFWPELQESGIREALEAMRRGHWLAPFAQSLIWAMGTGASPWRVDQLGFDHPALDDASTAVQCIDARPVWVPDFGSAEPPPSRRQIAQNLAWLWLAAREVDAGNLARGCRTEEVLAAWERSLREFWPELEPLGMREALAAVPEGHWLRVVAQRSLREVEGRPFPDVPADHWASDAVEHLRRAGVIIGYPSGEFARP